MSSVFDGPEVVLEEMLAAREKRVAWQKKLLASEPENSLLSATMAIPGPVKTSPQLLAAFKKVTDAVEASLGTHVVTANLFLTEKTGPEYYLLVKLTPAELKEKMVAIENNHALGRLVDLDVLFMADGQIKSISRDELGYPLRRCFICNNEAKVCGRQRAHSVLEMQEHIAMLIDNEKLK